MIYDRSASQSRYSLKCQLPKRTAASWQSAQARQAKLNGRNRREAGLEVPTLATDNRRLPNECCQPFGQLQSSHAQASNDGSTY
ncbi:MAG: hypothetical protein U1E02_05785 [Hydrogenophaga sp.]|nr:hypothetical protein [Hydrogenophaga sp.]